MPPINNYGLYNPYAQPQAQEQQQNQNSVLISVANEDVARNWPIGPGVSLLFKDERLPYLYSKTAGVSQFDAPIFEKYLITKEEDPVVEETNNDVVNLQSQLAEMQNAYAALKNDIEDMKNWMRQPFMSMGGMTNEQ